MKWTTKHPINPVILMAGAVGIFAGFIHILSLLPGVVVAIGLPPLLVFGYIRITEWLNQ